MPANITLIGSLSCLLFEDVGLFSLAVIYADLIFCMLLSAHFFVFIFSFCLFATFIGSCLFFIVVIFDVHPCLSTLALLSIFITLIVQIFYQLSYSSSHTTIFIF